MGLFDMKCTKCKKEFEAIMKSSDKFCICDCGYVAKRTYEPHRTSFRLLGPCWSRDGFKGKSNRKSIGNLE